MKKESDVHIRRNRLKWFDVNERFPRKSYHRLEREMFEKKVIKSFFKAHPDTCIKEDVPVEVVIELYEPPTKSMDDWKQKDLCDGNMPLMKFPDAYEIVDIVTSALSSAAFHNKKQITSVLVRKRYGWLDKITIGIGEFQNE